MIETNRYGLTTIPIPITPALLKDEKEAEDSGMKE